MARKKPEGNCHICGRYETLSFEHVPPNKAFNDKPVILKRMMDVINEGPDLDMTNKRGKIQQRGMGGYTLCGRCNNLTGTWYAKDYIDWAHQGMLLNMKSNGAGSVYYPFYIYPLRVIKQIITMFFSLNGDKFSTVNQELVDFVLNKERKYISPKYKIYAYLKGEGNIRSSGVVSKIDVLSGANRAEIFSELTFPPFGYVLCLDSPPPDKRLVDITYFTRFSYNEWDIVYLKIDRLPTYMTFPGDYRTKREILDQAASNDEQIKNY